MAQEEGEIGVTQVVRILGVHRDTVYRWGVAALAGERSPIKYCRKDASRHLWFSREEIFALKQTREQITQPSA